MTDAGNKFLDDVREERLNRDSKHIPICHHANLNLKKMDKNSGLSSSLGLKNMTEAGFLLDKNIDDDSLPAFIPIIFHHEESTCGLHGLFGSNNAFLNGQILYNLIMRDLDVSTAIEYPRYYYVSDGMVIENNQGHSMEAALRVRLHPMISSLPTDDSLLVESVNVIIKRKDSLSSHSDSRGNGIASRF